MSPPVAEPPASRRLTGWKKRVALLIILMFSMIVSLLICEVAARLFLPPNIMPRWVENAPYGIRKQVGNVRGFIVTPQYRHRFSTNSKGFRGTNEYAVPKPPGLFRALALGDSVVCGYGVEDDQTFCAKMERKLSPSRRLEVLNLGIPGFGNAEELIQLEQVGFEYQPDLIILGYFVNDHFENITSDLYRLQEGKLFRNERASDPAFFLRDRLSRIPGYNFFCQHSYLLNFLRLKASNFFRGRVGQKHMAGSYTGENPDERQIALTAALIDQIIGACSKRGIPVVVLNIPMQENGQWMKNMPTEKLALSEQAKIVDVAKEIWNQEPIWNIAHTEGYHPKEKGHELIADWLANYIKTNLWTQPGAAKKR
jgi:lysophospholipase L1-like esterase